MSRNDGGVMRIKEASLRLHTHSSSFISLVSLVFLLLCKFLVFDTEEFSYWCLGGFCFFFYSEGLTAIIEK